MKETVSDTHILALFTTARVVDIEQREGKCPPPSDLAKRIGIRTDQVQSVLAGRNAGSGARERLLAFNGLSESDLADRPDFAVEEPPEEQTDKDVLGAIRTRYGHLFLTHGGQG
jgi:hypothetical protein